MNKKIGTGIRILGATLLLSQSFGVNLLPQSGTFDGDTIQHAHAEENSTQLVTDQRIISNVAYDDAAYGRNAVLQVAGKPFYYNGVQIRIDKLRDDPQYGFDSAGLAKLFKQAATDGFNTAGCQIRWTDVQPNHHQKASETAVIKSADDQDVNFASEKSLSVAGAADSAQQIQSLVKINLSDLQPEEIDGAALRLALTQGMSSSKGLKIYALKDHSWEKESVTWKQVNGTEGIGKDKLLLSQSPTWDKIKAKHVYDFYLSELFTAEKNQEYISPEGTISLLIEEDPASGKAGETLTFAAEAATDAPELIYSDAEEFNFDYLNEAIDFAKDAGMKFEVLWFGTDTCSLSTDQRVPVHILANYQKTMSDSTTPLFKKFAANSITGVYGYNMCKNDEAIRKLEATALKNTFNAIDERGDQVVIGVQTSNEPGVGLIHGSKKTGACRCESCVVKQGELSDAEFREQTMWEYNENLAKAVKESNYSVWTRINLAESADTEMVKYNESKRETVGTHIDFIGIDHYRHTPSQLYNEGQAGKQFTQGHNISMLMELGQKDNRSAGLFLAEDSLATHAGGSYVHIYDLLSSDGCQIYQLADGQANTFEHFDQEIKNLFQVNQMLTKIPYELATELPGERGGNKLVYFNGRSTDEQVDEANNIVNQMVTFQSSQTGVGIAVHKNEKQTAYLSTKEGDRFVLNSLTKADLEKVELGYYTQDNQWVSEGELAVTEENEQVVLSVPAYSCVQVTTKEARTPVTVVEFTAEAEGKTTGNVSLEEWNDGASGGAWVKANAKKVGDQATVTVEIPEDGSYQIVTRYYANVNRGIVKTLVDDVEYGEPIDMYAASGKKGFKNSAPITVALTKGIHRFTYEVSGKNSKSSDYVIPLDYLRFTKLGELVKKDKLQALYDEWINQAQGTYTNESWATLRTALVDAEAVLTDPKAEQLAVDTVFGVLENAVDRLEDTTWGTLEENREQLEQLIQVAKAAAAKTTEYSAESIAKLEVEIANAHAYCWEEPAATIKGFKQYLQQLQAAIDQLESLNVLPESLTVNLTGITTLKVKQTCQITAEIAPTNATDQTIQWQIANPKIAAIDPNGQLTALKTGTTRITGSTINGKTATFTIRVTK